MTKRSPYRLRIIPTPAGQWFGRLMVSGTEIGRIAPCATPEDVCIAAIKTMKASPDYITVRNGAKVVDLNAGRSSFSLLRVCPSLEDRFDTTGCSEDAQSIFNNFIGKTIGGALAAEARVLQADVKAQPNTDAPDSESH